MHEHFMKIALAEAQQAMSEDEVPIGCVIVYQNEIIAKTHNQRESLQQSIAHAEMIAIQHACKFLNSWRLEHCTLYVTLEPCPMCAGAIIQARIPKLVYGAKDPKGGAVASCLQMYEKQGFNHYPEVLEGVLEEQSSTLLKQFFSQKRGK